MICRPLCYFRSSVPFRTLLSPDIYGDEQRAEDAKSDTDLRKIAQLIKNMDFDILGSAPWKDAQVTSGGISGECVDDRLQLRSEKGIFLCGEILDIDGIEDKCFDISIPGRQRR